MFKLASLAKHALMFVLVLIVVCNLFVHLHNICKRNEQLCLLFRTKDGAATRNVSLLANKNIDGRIHRLSDVIKRNASRIPSSLGNDQIMSAYDVDTTTKFNLNTQMEEPSGNTHTTVYTPSTQFESSVESTTNLKFPSSTQKNVLFLVADDLRPQLNSYGGLNNPNPLHPVKMYTPNLDALSRRSLQLNRAYVQYAVCSPSRASYMTSRRPDTTKVWDLQTFWRNAGGNFTTIPQYFKDHGYKTQGMGKIYHPGPGGGQNDRISWSERYIHSRYTEYYQYIQSSWWAVPPEVSTERPLPDQEMVGNAIKFMRNHAKAVKKGDSEQPFFLAVGFVKPHLPFVFPERFLDYYDWDDIQVADNSYPPQNFPLEGWFHVEANRYSDIQAYNVTEPFQTLPDLPSRVLRRAYFSCVSYIDHLVGRLLHALKELDLHKNTVVSFLGDHGLHLGENALWGKHTNLEQSTHAPLMIHIPGRTNQGIQSDSLVEFLDVFPSLVEAAGLDPVPICPELSNHIHLCTEGQSFLGLINKPRQQFRTHVTSQMARRHSVGYTIRTNTYRYVEWAQIRRVELGDDMCRYDIVWRKNSPRELYDYVQDPQENVNVAAYLENKEVVERFSYQLKQSVASSIERNCHLLGE